MLRIAPPQVRASPSPSLPRSLSPRPPLAHKPNHTMPPISRAPSDPTVLGNFDAWSQAFSDSHLTHSPPPQAASPFAALPPERSSTASLERGRGWEGSRYENRNPQPSTLHPQPSTLKPQPSNLNPQTSTLTLQPTTLERGRGWEGSRYPSPPTPHLEPRAPIPYLL